MSNRTSELDDRARATLDAAPGIGLVLGSALGTVVGLLVSGAMGIAIGAGIGAGLGLVAGAIVAAVLARRAAPPDAGLTRGSPSGRKGAEPRRREA